MNDYISKMNKHYNNCFSRYGSVPQGAAWGGDQERNLRRDDAFLDFFKKNVNKYESILDVGCGYGRSYALLNRQNIEVDYYGIDILDKYIKYCQNTYKKCTFWCGDFLYYPIKRNFDYVIAYGIFNYKGDSSLKSVSKIVRETVRKMYLLSNKCTIINMISSHVNFFADGMFYMNPVEIFSWCLNELTSSVVIEHSKIVEYEYTIFLYRDI